MASNLNNSDYIVGVQAAALATEADGGYIRIYDGIQPHTADNPVGFSSLLAELRFGSLETPHRFLSPARRRKTRAFQDREQACSSSRPCRG
jgi:hypothetical protein